MTGDPSGLRRPAMLVLAACFAFSALSRFADPQGALAYEVKKLAADAPAESPETAAATDMTPLLAAIRERERQLDERSRKLAEKTRLMEAAETRIRDQMASLEKAEERLSELVRIARSSAREDVDKLVAAYQTMGGKRAGPIFETMDDAFASGLLSRMDEASAAGILAAMSPEKAYAVTVHMAGQNARAPKE